MSLHLPSQLQLTPPTALGLHAQKVQALENEQKLLQGNLLGKLLPGEAKAIERGVLFTVCGRNGWPPLVLLCVLVASLMCCRAAVACHHPITGGFDVGSAHGI